MKLYRRFKTGEERQVYQDKPVDTFAEVEPGEKLVAKQQGWPEISIEHDSAGAVVKIGDGTSLRVRVDADHRVYVLARTDERPDDIM